jgi:PEP-CTERM motif
MRISGLFGAAIALSVLAPSAPAHANVLNTGDLMHTDLFQWQGQYGTPTWREIIANFDCTAELTFYLWNVPTPPPPVVIPPAPAIYPAVAASSANSIDGAVDPLDPIGLQGDGASSATTISVDPIGMLGGDGAGGATAVPEPSTWALLLLGFAGLGYAAFRRSKSPVSALA